MEALICDSPDVEPEGQDVDRAHAVGLVVMREETIHRRAEVVRFVVLKMLNRWSWWLLCV